MHSYINGGFVQFQNWSYPSGDNFMRPRRHGSSSSSVDGADRRRWWEKLGEIAETVPEVW